MNFWQNLQLPKLSIRNIVILLLLEAVACKPIAQTGTESSETSGTIVQFCPPFQTPLERSLWLSLVEHYVGKNYLTIT